MSTEGETCPVASGKASSWPHVSYIGTSYCGSFDTRNFYSEMSNSSLHQRLTSLKTRTLINNSDSFSNDQSTNYSGDRRIDKPNNSPPQGGLISSRVFEPVASVGECSHGDDTVDGNPGDLLCSPLRSLLSDPIGEGSNHNTEQATKVAREHEQEIVDVAGARTTLSAAKTNEGDLRPFHSVPQIIVRTPTVLITPAESMEENSEDNSVQRSNGGLPGATLKDDASSVSSGCSGDEFLTDDDRSEDENATDCKSPIKQKARWKKIRNMIHWSPFVQNFKKKYPWVQLAGHQGCFKPGENGAILKRSSDKERECLTKLMKDILRPYIPEYKREVEKSGEKYLEMQDLLQEFDSPSVMDCKMGVRTYLEEELAKVKSKPRKDLYQKMFDVDPNEPTEEERREGAITKPRYMQWRERLSSSATLGFRIEGVAKGDEKPTKDFKKTKTKVDVARVFTDFVDSDDNIRVIGSSLLFVHDSKGRANVWMIDFGKTVPVHDGIRLDHRKPWVEGNHEDGYLWGLDNMLETWSHR